MGIEVEAAAKREKWMTILLTIGIAVFLLMIVITNIFHFNFRMNSDTAADAIYAKLVWDTKQIIPDRWYIATETQIICTPNLAALFYGLTRNMVLSEGMACCVMMALILLSVLYFGRLLHFQKRERLLFAFLCLMLPADYILLELSYLFAAYYAVHVIALFFTLGVYLVGLRDKSLKWVKMAAGVLFALLLGMQGARGVLVIYGPLFGMMVIYNLYRMYCGQKKDKSEVIISLWTVVLLVISFLGMLFPRSVGQELSRNIRNGFHKLWSVVLPDMVRAIGFDDAQPVLVRICTLLLFLTTIFWLVDVLYRMCRKETLKTEEWGGAYFAQFSGCIGIDCGLYDRRKHEKILFSVHLCDGIRDNSVLQENQTGQKTAVWIASGRRHHYYNTGNRASASYLCSRAENGGTAAERILRGGSFSGRK